MTKPLTVSNIKNNSSITIDKIKDNIKKNFPTMPLHKFNYLINKIKLMNINDLLLEAEEIIYPNCHPDFWNF